MDHPQEGQGHTTPAEGRISTYLVRHRVIALILLGALLYIPSLGLRDFWYPDEPDIAEVVKAMYISGDWVAPRRMGVIWVDYPPLLYWAGATSAHVFGGVSAFAFRLTSALTAIALAVMTCWVGARWYSPRAGLWAGFILLTMQQFALQAVGYRPDLLFTLGIAGGLFVYAAGAGDRPRWFLRVAGFALLGVAMLAKGPLGLLLPGLVLTLWHGSRREWRRLFELAPLSLVALAVYMPWFAACAKAMGSDNILYELYAQNVARFFGGARGHAKPFYYFLVVFWRDLYPWGPVLPFALWHVWRNGGQRDRNQQLLLWWLGAFFVFLSIAITKRQIYMLPVYPVAALILGNWVAKLSHKDEKDTPSPRIIKAYGWIVAGFLILIGLAVLGAAGPGFEAALDKADLFAQELLAAHQIRLSLVIFGMVMLASGLWIAIAARDARPGAIAWRLGISHAALYVVLLMWILPSANPARTYRPAGEWMLANMGDSTHFGLLHPKGNLGFRKMGGFGYHTGRLVELLETSTDVEQFFEQHPGSIALVHESAAPGLFSGDGVVWRESVIRDDLYAGGYQYLVLQHDPRGDSPEESPTTE
ncbi:MAG: hypothetical protein GY906_40040 [bacterium]|nr:hypothetical protein [bacterium]